MAGGRWQPVSSISDRCTNRQLSYISHFLRYRERDSIGRETTHQSGKGARVHTKVMQASHECPLLEVKPLLIRLAAATVHDVAVCEVSPKKNSPVSLPCTCQLPVQSLYAFVSPHRRKCEEILTIKEESSFFIFQRRYNICCGLYCM